MYQKLRHEIEEMYNLHLGRYAQITNPGTPQEIKNQVIEKDNKELLIYTDLVNCYYHKRNLSFHLNGKSWDKLIDE
jgi:hypothetical protein